MANRDYVKRGQGSRKSNKRKKPQSPKFRVVGLIAVLFVTLFGFGLYTLSQDPEPTTVSPIVEPESLPAQKKEEPDLPPLPKEEWDFVTSLPNKEIEVEAKEQVISDIPYIMQCGAFKTLSQAEERKVNIAFQGISSRVYQKKGSAWYRVILGPYALKREAERDRHKLQRAKIEPCAIWKESL